MGAIDTTSLDNINAQLEGITTVLDGYFETIEKEILGANRDKAQQILDEKAQEISNKLSKRIQPIRQKVIDLLKAQVEKITEKVAPLLPLWKIVQGEVTLDPMALVEPLIAICEVLVAPYQPYLDLATEVAPKLVELSNNLSKIASYSPSIDLPEGINPPTFNIPIEPITPSDIGL